MTITLAVGATTVGLHPDLYWADETDWQPVEQSMQRTVTGAIVLSAATRVAGRPITLQPTDERSAWLTRAAIDQLRAWAAIPGQEMTLTLRGAPRTVVWRHQDGAIEAAPLVHYSDVDAGDYYLATLRFMET